VSASFLVVGVSNNASPASMGGASCLLYLVSWTSGFYIWSSGKVLELGEGSGQWAAAVEQHRPADIFRSPDCFQGWGGIYPEAAHIGLL